MVLKEGRILRAALVAVAAYFFGSSAFATTFSFETDKWKLTWEDFSFGVSSWGDGGVALTWGADACCTDGYGNPTAYGGSIPGWGAVSVNGALSAASNTGTTFSLAAKPGYALSDLGIQASGIYSTYNAGQVDPSITLGVQTQGSLNPIVTSAGLELGVWRVDSGPIAGAVGAPLSFNIQQTVSGSAFGDIATSAGDQNGIGLYWSVAAVPEPHEWAMMLSGLGLVAVIAHRRRKFAGETAR